jgi:MFS family permease
MFATCALVGPIYDRGGYRWLLFIGSFGIVFGHMMLSLSKTYWEAILTQGMMVGIGGGCLFVPAVAIMPTYFSSKLGTAYGLASSGSSLGGVIYPMMFYHLTDQIGFGWSTRILGFTSLVTLIIPLTVLEMRVKPTAVRSLVDWTAFTDGPFMAYVVGTFFGFTGCYVAFFYISYFGQASGITDTSLSFYLVPILNAVSIFGRIIPGWLSDKIGLMNIMAPCKSFAFNER